MSTLVVCVAKTANIVAVSAGRALEASGCANESAGDRPGAATATVPKQNPEAMMDKQKRATINGCRFMKISLLRLSV
jgi:hypothetical protein